MAPGTKIIVIAGPTASGKTEVAVRLARAVGAEVVSADSMQVYRGMDIGTAKPSDADRAAVPHHMLDVVAPDEDFNADLYRKMALPIIHDIVSRGRICLLVGGTGLYMKALTGGLFECPPSDPLLRERLLAMYDRLGRGGLHSRLCELDTQAASRIHPNDRVRVTRAMEIISLTGRMPSRLADEHGFRQGPFEELYVCLDVDRQSLHGRIDRRSVKMVESGLVEETASLLASGFSPGLKAMKGLGYRHMIGYLEGERTLEEAVRILQRDTRRYAKRQMTWFRKIPGVIWKSPDDFKGIHEVVVRHMAGFPVRP